MKTFIAALALASIAATSAVAKNEKTQTIYVEPNNNVVCGRVILTDPDPAIRAQLLRDCALHDGRGN